MTTQETLVKYLTDIHAVENHLAHTLKIQLKDPELEHFAEANSLLKRLQLRTDNSLSGLEIILKEFGTQSSSTVKDTVTAAAGALLGAVSQSRTHHVSKMLRDDYTTLSLLSIGYELLHATGNALESSQVASLSLTNLKEVAGFIMETSQSIIPVAVEELGKTNTVNPTAVKISQENIWNAWRTADK